jgi:creatinine amidohydrolase
MREFEGASTWLEGGISEAMDSEVKSKPILIAVGAIEVHGRHLPLGTDWMIASFIRDGIAKQLPSVRGPVLTMGCSSCFLSFPGTISLRPETLTMLLTDMVVSLACSKPRAIVFINGHGGNVECLNQLVSECAGKSELPPMLSLNWWDAEIVKGLRSRVSSYFGDHADRLETELMLINHPELVSMETAADCFFPWPRHEPEDFKSIIPDGVYGYPSFASPEAGRQTFDVIVSQLASMIREFLAAQSQGFPITQSAA